MNTDREILKGIEKAVDKGKTIYDNLLPTRYEVDLEILGVTKTIHVAVDSDIPEEHHDKFIQLEVFDYLKSVLKFTYSQRLFY